MARRRVRLLSSVKFERGCRRGRRSSSRRRRAGRGDRARSSELGKKRNRSGSRATTSSCGTTRTTRSSTSIAMLQQLFGHPAGEGLPDRRGSRQSRPGDRADHDPRTRRAEARPDSRLRQGRADRRAAKARCRRPSSRRRVASDCQRRIAAGYGDDCTDSPRLPTNRFPADVPWPRSKPSRSAARSTSTRRSSCARGWPAVGYRDAADERAGRPVHRQHLHGHGRGRLQEPADDSPAGPPQSRARGSS